MALIYITKIKLLVNNDVKVRRQHKLNPAIIDMKMSGLF